MLDKLKSFLDIIREKLPMRIIKNAVVVMILIIGGVCLYNIYSGVLGDIAVQHKAINRREGMEIAQEQLTNKDSKGEHMEQLVESNLEEGDSEVKEKKFVPIEIALFHYIKFALVLIVMSMAFANMCISRFEKDSITKSFKGVFKKILHGFITVVITTVATSLFVINMSSYAAELDEENKKMLKETAKVKFEGVYVVDQEEDIDYAGMYKSIVSDQSVFVAQNGGKISLDTSIVDKTGVDCFNEIYSQNYGINSAILATNKGRVNIESSNIYADAKGASGLFSSGKGSKITVSNSKIQVLGKSTAYGLASSYQGVINGKNLEIETDGEACPSIMGGKKEGSVVVSKSSITSHGIASPIAYSKGEVSLNEIVGEAKQGNMLVVEDGGNLELDACDLVGGLGGQYKEDQAALFMYSKKNNSEDKKTAKCEINNSYLTVDDESEYYRTAPAILVSNTAATISLRNAVFSVGSRIILDVRALEKLGIERRNGGHAKVVADSQEMVGYIKVDEFSTLEMKLTKDSYFIGGINYSNEGSEKVSVSLDSSSRWVLTSNCYLTEFKNEDTTNSNVVMGRFKIFVNGKPIA